jgi:DNA-binding MarR family transcriptional regulator
MQFRMIIRAVREHYRQVQERCGVSGAQLWALAAVGAAKGIKVNDIARDLAIHQSTASNLVDVLEAKGAVERRRNAEDGRVVCVYITAAGRAVLRRAPKPSRGVLQQALEDLSDREVNALRKHLNELLRHMHTHIGAGTMPISDLLDGNGSGRRRRRDKRTST